MEWNQDHQEWRGMAGDYLVVVDGDEYAENMQEAEASGDAAAIRDASDPEQWLNIALSGTNPSVHYYATGEADPETR